MARQGNNPRRRIVAIDGVEPGVLAALAVSVVYVGSANHKRHPGNYGFHPPVNPRPWKTMCDTRRQMPREEAQALLVAGVRKEMISSFEVGGLPKYVWSVDQGGVPYEAKIGNGGYHGYPLEPDDEMSTIVLKQWAQR